MNDSKPLQLLEKGVLTMRLLSLLVVATTCYMWLAQIPVSDSQSTATMLVLGFYFGGETMGTIAKRLIDQWIEHHKEETKKIQGGRDD